MQYLKDHALSFQVSVCFCVCVCQCFLVVRECKKFESTACVLIVFLVTEGSHGDVGSALCATRSGTLDGCSDSCLGRRAGGSAGGFRGGTGGAGGGEGCNCCCFFAGFALVRLFRGGADPQSRRYKRERSPQRTVKRPAAPMPPPMHIVTTTFLAPRRLPSMRMWPT